MVWEVISLTEQNTLRRKIAFVICIWRNHLSFSLSSSLLSNSKRVNCFSASYPLYKPENSFPSLPLFTGEIYLRYSIATFHLCAANMWVEFHLCIFTFEAATQLHSPSILPSQSKPRFMKLETVLCEPTANSPRGDREFWAILSIVDMEYTLQGVG